MTTAARGQPSTPHWLMLYEAAILEIDLAKLPDRIKQANKAIHCRITEPESSDHNGECQRLADALNVLEDLLNMNSAQRPKHTTNNINRMLLGTRKTKPVLIYIALAIVILSLALTFMCSRQQRTPSPPTAPPHEDR